MTEFLQEALTGGFLNLLRMALFIIPMMIFIEVLRDLNALERLTRLGAPLTRLYRMPKEAALPILAGLVFGIALGAGVILQTMRDVHLSSRDIYIIHIFLVICHGIIEDSILFIAIGADALLIILPRIVAAVIIAYFFSQLLKPSVPLPPTPLGTGTPD